MPEAIAAPERVFSNSFQLAIFFERDFCQTLAVPKNAVLELLDALRNDYLFKSSVCETTFAELLESAAIRKGHAL